MTPKQLSEAFQEHDRLRSLEAQRRLSAEVERLAMMEPGDASSGLLDALDETLRAANMSRADFCKRLIPFATAESLRRRIEREDEAAIVERRNELESECERIKADRDRQIWHSVEWSDRNLELRNAETRLNECGFSLSQLKSWRRELADLESKLPAVKAPALEAACVL